MNMEKKKKGPRKKLNLHRKTLVRLSEGTLGKVAGGVCYVESAAPTDLCTPPPDPPPVGITGPKLGSTSKTTVYNCL
jgi:hypothetical protein